MTGSHLTDYENFIVNCLKQHTQQSFHPLFMNGPMVSFDPNLPSLYRYFKKFGDVPPESLTKLRRLLPLDLNSDFWDIPLSTFVLALDKFYPEALPYGMPCNTPNCTGCTNSPTKMGKPVRGGLKRILDIGDVIGLLVFNHTSHCNSNPFSGDNEETWSKVPNSIQWKKRFIRLSNGTWMTDRFHALLMSHPLQCTQPGRLRRTVFIPSHVEHQMDINIAYLTAVGIRKQTDKGCEARPMTGLPNFITKVGDPRSWFSGRFFFSFFLFCCCLLL